MTGFFINRGYPQQIIQQARNRMAVTPREAIISERVDAVVDQPTIPLVLTYYPTNTLVKSILTHNLHLLRNDPDTTAIFQPLPFYLPIVAIAICVTPWLGAPFMTRPLSMMTVEHFLVANPGVILALIRTSQHL